MKFALGFIAGISAAWAALAIWQRVPPLGPIDAADMDDIDRLAYLGELSGPFWGPRRGDRRRDDLYAYVDEPHGDLEVSDSLVRCHTPGCRLRYNIHVDCEVIEL